MRYCKELKRFINLGIDTGGSKEQWLRLKHEGLSATEIGVLMGLNTYKSAVDLFYEKTTEFSFKEENFDVTKERGKYLEPLVVKLYNREYGGEIWHNNTNMLFKHQDKPYMIATPDCISWHNEERIIRYVECKTAAGKGSRKWDAGVPMNYITQTQYVMNVLGIENGCISWLVDDIPGHLLVERDEALVDAMEYIVETFISDNIQKDIPPTPKTVSDFKKIYSSVVVDSAMMCTYELFKTLEEYSTLKQMITSHKDQVSLLEQRKNDVYCLIRKAVKDNEKVIIDDDVIATLKLAKGGSRRLYIYNKILEKKKGL